MKVPTVLIALIIIAVRVLKVPIVLIVVLIVVVNRYKHCRNIELQTYFQGLMLPQIINMIISSVFVQFLDQILVLGSINEQFYTNPV